MRRYKLIAGLALAMGVAAPGLWAKGVRYDNPATAQTRADIARDRSQLHHDVLHGHFIRANQDRRDLRRDHRTLNQELREARVNGYR